MASATEIRAEIKSAAMTGTVRVDDTVRVGTPSVRATTYYLLWRTRASQPWHSEEFDSRNRAHHRYFELIQRGVEAYLEKRQRSGLSE